MKGTMQAMSLFRIAHDLSDTLDREAPLTQLLVLLRVAAAGDEGIDQGKLQDELQMSSAGISRTIQALGDTHYLKDRAGYGLVSRAFDPTDNRRRLIKLTARGEKAIERTLAMMERRK